MVLSVAMMLTMFPTGVLADDFDLVENAAGITENVEGQSNDDQGEGESASIVSEEPAPAESEDQTTDPAASASQAAEPVESTSQTTEPVESESQVTEPVESESQATEPVASESQATEPAASSSQATEPVESASQAADPAASESQTTEPVESESQAADPAASASQAAEPEEKDNSVNTADLYNPQPTADKEITINPGQKNVTLQGEKGVGHSWSVTSGKDHVEILGKTDSSTLKINGKTAGQATITHSYYWGYYTETFQIYVVNAVTDASIRVEGEASTTTPLTLHKYEERQLEAVVTPADAEYESCTWSVDDGNVLEVNAETGAITAKSVGETTVKLTVKNYDDSEVTAELQVTVTDPVAPTDAKFVVNNQEVTEARVTKGDTIDLTAKILPEDAQGYTCTWESSDDTKATVTPVAGDATKVTGVEPTGETPVKITLTVTPESAAAAASADEAANGTSVTKTIEITVTDLPKVTEVTINGADTVTQFQTIRLTPEIVQQVGAAGYTCEWSSSNSEILSVDQDGVVTGRRQGKATVTLTVANPDGTTASATKEIEVVKNEKPDESNLREAAIFCLIDPTKSPESNVSGYWTPTAGEYGKPTSSLGNATVNIEGWGDAKNCTDNVDQRVVSWPSGGNQIAENSDVWNTIVRNYKTTVERDLGVTISPGDVESITLIPFKLSQGNSTTTDIHLDCKVDIKCKNVYTATYKVMDAGSKEYRDLGGKNYKKGESTKPLDVTSETFEPTKVVDGVTYTFSGWYLDRECQIPAQFPYTLTQNTTFYAKYEPGYNVNYDLNGGTWDETTSERVIAGRIHVVKGMTATSQPTRPGYTFAGWTVTGLENVSEYNYPADKNASFTMPGNNVTLTAKWNLRADLSYTIKCYWNNTEEEIYSETVQGVQMNATLEVAPPENVSGYTPVSKDNKSLTIGADNDENVVKFYYYKNVTLQANSDTLPYNGKEQSVSGFTGAPEDADFSAINVGAAGTDAGTYPAEFPEGTVGTVDANKKYIVTVAKNGQLTITKRTVTLKSADLDKKYDGNALENGNAPLAVEDGFVDGEGATYAFTGSQTLVGSSDNEFTYTLNEGTDAGNYTINTQFGKLKVTDREEGDKLKITVEANSGSKTYDGKPLTVDGFKTQSFEVEGNTYTVEGLTASATGTNVSDSKDVVVEGTAVVKDAAGNDVTAQFKVETKNGTLTITKRTVTLKSADLDKKYDGNALENGNAPLAVEDGFVDGEGATYAFTGSQTLVGSSDNEFTYTLNEGTDAGNYTINTQFGKLKVTDREEGDKLKITVEANSGSKTYDGKPLTVDGFKTQSFEVEGNTYTVEGLTASATGTNVSDSKDVVVEGTAVVKDAAGNDVTKQFTVTSKPGKLTINPYMISIEPTETTFPYNGEEPKVKTDKIEIRNENDGKGLLLNHHVESIETEGSGVDAGTYEWFSGHNAKILDGNNDVTANYQISYTAKTMTITPAPLTVTTEGGSKVYDGKPLTNEVGNITGLVNGETAKVKTTGSQTNVGTSDNTYVIEWGTAKVGNYKVTQENLGKLEVTAQSINPKPEKPDPEKPDEKDPAYGGVQIDSPSDSVYDGTEHKWVPTVLDKDGKALTDADYKVIYSTENFTDATGTITVTITGAGNYTGTVTRTYKITPAPLKITTNSAEKTYDGSALTAGGKIEGLVKGETATLKTTGSQTEVGESKNTYEIEWDGTAKEANYTIAEEDVTLGTLKVNARSGGGSSSKPTPEEELTPTPTPTPLPTLPTTPAPTTPARRVTRSTATVTEPTSRPTEQITENETPKAESEPEVIEDEETPLAPMAGGAWALVNLILMLLTVLASLLLLLGYLGKKKYAKEDEYGNALHDANGNEIIDYTRNKKGFWRVASLIPAIAAVIAFALTENMRLPMVMTDRWTLLMVIIAVVQLIVAVLCKKKKESEEDENQANA